MCSSILALFFFLLRIIRRCQSFAANFYTGSLQLSDIDNVQTLSFWVIQCNLLYSSETKATKIKNRLTMLVTKCYLHQNGHFLSLKSVFWQICNLLGYITSYFKAVAILPSTAIYHQRLFCRELFVIGQSK